DRLARHPLASGLAHGAAAPGASREGHAGGQGGKVRALVYLLTHSFGGRALAVLRVTTNSGATTPGVDGATWNTPEDKTEAFNTRRAHGYSPQPLRRVYIPKSNGKPRPPGIPTITDRARQ